MAEQVITKKCCHCKQIKPLTEFCKNKSREDFHQNYCKICSSKYNKKYASTEKARNTKLRYESTDGYKYSRAKSEKKYYLKHIDEKKIYQKKYAQTERGKEVLRRNTIKNRTLFPEKRTAGIVVNNEIVTGRISRASAYHCRYCWNPAEHYHHHRGYAPEHWLDIQPICCQCHVNIHHKKSLFITPSNIAGGRLPTPGQSQNRKATYFRTPKVIYNFVREPQYESFPPTL